MDIRAAMAGTAAAVLAFTWVGETAQAQGPPPDPTGPIVERISIWADDAQATDPSKSPSVSDDGRYVVFLSKSTATTFPGDTFGGEQVCFLRDRVAGTTTPISLYGGTPFLEVRGCVISGNGRFAAFAADARGFLPVGDVFYTRDVFWRDLETGAVLLSSLRPDGKAGGGDNPSISDDGQNVAFEGDCKNLVNATDWSQFLNICVWDTGGGIAQISNPITPSIINPATFPSDEVDGGSINPAISGDGSWVAFASNACNLVGDGTCFLPTGGGTRLYEIYVASSVGGGAKLVSSGSGGVAGNGVSGLPAISDDGGYVAFESWADNLELNDTNGKKDIFVKDVGNGVLKMVSVNNDGIHADLESARAAINADGTLVAFSSQARNLDPIATSGQWQIYLRDHINQKTHLVSAGPGGDPGLWGSTEPAIDDSGKWIAFSTREPFVGGDTNNTEDIYLRDMGDIQGPGPHGIQITAGPAGDPNPSLPGGEAQMSVTAEDDNPLHTLGYGWSADCSTWAGHNGSFDDATAQNPIWTGPDNTTGSTQACQIKVVVSDNVGVSAEAAFTQNVSPVPGGLGNLVVTPSSDLLFRGPAGGPFFSPQDPDCTGPICIGFPSKNYNLENDGGASITYAAEHATGWINLAPSLDSGLTSSGTLAAGTNTDISVSINTSADTLCVGDYSGPVGFDSPDDVNGMVLRIINLTVNPAEGNEPQFPDDTGAGLPDVTAEATGLLTSVTILAPLVTDASTFTLTVDNPGPYPVGATVITWAAVDCSGNVGTANQKVVIIDATPPVVTPSDPIVVEAQQPLTPILGAEAIFDPNGEVSASDNVAVLFGPYLNGAAEDQLRQPVLPPGAPLPLGPYFIQWVAIDSSFNPGAAWQSVTIVDTTGPDLTIPEDIDITVDSFPVTIDPEKDEPATAVDLVDPNPFIVRNPTGPLVFDAPGTRQVKYRARDFEGNRTVDMFQTVTVRTSVKLVGLEVIQVEQDLNNSIPLIGNKQTLVRAYFSTPSVKTLAPKLIGTVNGNQLAQTLSPKDFGAEIVATTDVLAERESVLVPNDLRDLAATFEIPGSWNRPGTTITFKVEIPGDEVVLDCQDGIGSVNNDCEVTATFFSSLPVQVRLFQVNYKTKDGVTHKPTSNDMNNVVRRLLALYPIDRVTAVSDVLPTDEFDPGTPSVGEVNDQLNDEKFWDGCFWEFDCFEVYYGVISKDNGGSGEAWCCWQGFGPAVASGVAQDDNNTDGVGSGNHYLRFIGPHEIGHLYDTDHPYWKEKSNGDDMGPCGNTQVTTFYAPVWPWITEPGDLNPIPQSIWGSGSGSDQAGSQSNPNGRAGLIGPIVLPGEETDAAYAKVIIGYDSNRDRFISPRTNFELMSYCAPRFKWPGKPTYLHLFNVFEPDSSPYEEDPFDPSPFPNAVTAAVEPANVNGADTYLVIPGRLSETTGEVEFKPFATITSPSIVPPPMPEGDYVLELLDRKDNLLGEISFDIFDTTIDPTNEVVNVPFLIPVPFNEALHEVRVVKDGLVIGSKVSSRNAPTVHVIYPNGGETLVGDTVTIEWEGKDKNKDPLSYTVQFSPDGGTTWDTLTVGHKDSFFEANLDFLSGSDEGLIRVQATDGFRAATDVSDGTFSKSSSPPSVIVLAPQPFQVYGGDQLVVAKAMTNDLEDGQLGDDDVQWVSSIDGPLGAGENFSLPSGNLTPGVHQLTAIGTDSDGTTGEDSVTIHVLGSDFPPLVVANVATHPATLWPPDHVMVPVRVDVNAMALPDLDDPECAITGISSNEAVEGSGDGMTSEDWVVTGPLTVDLRAERSGHGTGREYTIDVACTTMTPEGPEIAESSGVVQVPFNE